jgi:hypothetical protein
MGRSFAARAAAYDTVFVASATCCAHLKQADPAAGRVRYAPEVWVERITTRSKQAEIPIYLHRPCHDVGTRAQFRAYERWVEETANVAVIPRPFRDPVLRIRGCFLDALRQDGGSDDGPSYRCDRRGRRRRRGERGARVPEPLRGAFRRPSGRAARTFLVSRGIA